MSLSQLSSFRSNTAVSALPSRRTLRCCAKTENVTLAPPDITTLGKSGVKVPVIGVGAWAWGDRSQYWANDGGNNKDRSRTAYDAIIKSGLTFIDTAEVYGFGKSEEFLGDFMKETGTSPQIATKFAPQPWRLTAGSVPDALKASLKRLQLPKVTLYMLHWPGIAWNTFFNDAYADGLVRVHEAGLAEAVGVSNYNEQRVRHVVKKLAASDVPLASNQVQYSLLYRTPERNGVLEACKELGVTMVAYSPLAQGLLTGKYSPGGDKPYGARGLIFSDERIRQVQPVLAALEAVGKERSKTPAQVALNWVVCKGALPIPGAKNAHQMEEITGAVGWRLSEGEVAELDRVSAAVPTGLGAPFENW